MLYFGLFANSCLLIVLICQGVLSHHEHFRPSFHKFIQTHKKEYKTQAEHEYRFNVFVQNMKQARAIQQDQQGTATYGVTQFSDLTEAEFKAQYSGINQQLRSENTFPTAKIPKVKLPKQFDWRERHVVTQVKNQGICASCWAFAATGNIESLWAIKHKKKVLLSEQQLIDCDNESNGCKGGEMTSAYKSIVRLGGIEKESSYLYAETNLTCEFKKSKVAVKISGGVNIPKDEVKMAKWLVKNGPIAVSLNMADMQLYEKGIAHPNVTQCDPTKIDHAVLLVGYGVENEIKYWIMKNSWGRFWGENGYYRIYRGENVCGLLDSPSSAVL